MTPMRVRAFYTRYPHWGAHSGFQQLCRYFDPAAVRVDLRAVSDSDEDWPIPGNPVNTWLRTQVQRRGMAWYKLSDLAAEIATVPAVLQRRVDIVHFLDAEHTGQYLPAWSRRWGGSRVKTVGTFHQPPELLPRLVNPAVVANLDHVFVVSPSQVPYFRAFLPAERVHVILHGIDTTFFCPRPAREPDGRFRCITVGHWMRDWRAMRAVADELAADAGIELHIVTNRSTGLEGIGSVHRHENVDDEGLRGLYREADVLLLPLENATANNSLLEGLACGLPVISTDIESVRSYTGPAAAHLVAGNAPRAIVEAIRRLRDDTALRTRMGAAARQRAEELAWPRVAGEWQRAYAALTASRT